MLYTFTVTETQLDRITAYLDKLYYQDHRQYILAVQHQLWDDLIIVIIDCSPESATFIQLLI